VSGELRRFLESLRMEHTRGAPYHPMTQGKIERYHRSMKNLVQLRNYAFPWDREQEIAGFVDFPGLPPGQATITTGTMNRWATSRRRTCTSGKPSRFSQDGRKSNAER
jgi:transposase InsO family protein